MKKLIIILCVLIAALAAGVYFLLPTNINWEKYAKEMSENVKARTGLTLNIQGNPIFSMKPSPILKLGQIRLGNVKDATYPQMMTAAHAEILFDTASLFRRKIKVKKITLFSPQFYFETMPNGKWNWQMAFFDKAASNASIGFDSLLLTEGKAEVKQDKYSPVQKWDRVNAEMFADSLQGPFFFEGNFAAISSSFGFSLKVEKYLNGQSPDFSLRLINAPAEASFVFTGRYGLSETDRGMLTGGLTFDVRKPDQFFALLYPQEKLPPPIFQPLVGNLKINKTAQTRTTELTDVLFQYGTSSASGKLSIRSLSPQEASVRQAEKDAVEDEDEEIVLRDPNNPSAEVKLDDLPVSETKIAQNLLPKVVDGSFVFSKLDADPFVDNLPAIAVFLANSEYFKKTQDSYVLKLMFDVVNYKKDVIHQVKGRLENRPNGVAFEDFSATLPSNAYVNGSAALALNKTPILSGKAAIDAANINAVLNWLGIPVAEEIPQNLMRQLKAEADFKLALNGLILQQMKGTLDKTDFSGSFALRKGKRNAVSFSMDVSDLNLAQYFPVRSKDFIQKREDFSRLSVKEKLKKLFDELAFFNEFDLNAKLTANIFSWADIKAENVKSDFSIVRGQMKISELSADKVFASTISLQGETEGFGGEAKFNNFKVNVDSKQLSSLTQALGISLPRGLSPQDKMLLSAKVTGTMLMMDFETSVDFGAARFVGQGDFKEVAPDQMNWNASVDIYHENFRNFIRLFSDSYRPILANPGALTLKGQAIKSKSGFQFQNMNVQIGDNSFSGSFKMRDQGEIPVVEAEITGGDLALLGAMPKINFIESLSIDTRKIIPENIWEKEGGLTLLFSDPVFSKKPFDFSFLGKYEATITTKANNLFLNSLVLSDFDGIIKLSSDKIIVDVRRALWNKANFGGIFNLMPTKDALSMRGAVRISNINVPANLFLSDTLNIGSVESMVLNVNVSGNGKSTDALMSSLVGTGSFSFEKGYLEKFDMSRLYQDFLKLPDLSLETVQDDALRGQTELTRFSADVNIKDGVFSLRPGTFFYNGAKNASPFFEYNYLGRTLSAGVSFSSGMPSVPDISLSVKKAEDQPAVLSQNIKDVAGTVINLKNQQKTRALQERQKQIQKEKEGKEKIRRQQLDRLNRMDERLTLATAEITKKASAVRSMSEKVYLVHKNLLPLENAEKILTTLSQSVQKTKSLVDNGISDAMLDALEQKIKNDYFDKEGEFDSNYNMAMIVGTKGFLFDVVKQSNDMLLAVTKEQAANTDLSDISENVDEIKNRLKNIKDIQSKSEKENLGLEDLTVLLGQAQAELDAATSARQKITNAIEQKKMKIAAEEKAKQEAEELKKKAEEEAKKAAEAAAAAEKAKKEAEERERQRTIIRKDGTQTSSKTTAGASAVLQPQLSLIPEEEPSAESRQEEKKENSIVIRRR